MAIENHPVSQAVDKPWRNKKKTARAHPNISLGEFGPRLFTLVYFATCNSNSTTLLVGPADPTHDHQTQPSFVGQRRQFTSFHTDTRPAFVKQVEIWSGSRATLRLVSQMSAGKVCLYLYKPTLCSSQQYGKFAFSPFSAKHTQRELDVTWALGKVMEQIRSVCSALHQTCLRTRKREVHPRTRDPAARPVAAVGRSCAIGLPSWTKDMHRWALVANRGLHS